MNPVETGSNPTPESAQQKSPVQAALEDAEVLADYVASEAITDAEQHVSTIARARESFTNNGRLMGPEQHDFYLAYAALAEAVRPVTVGSLRDSLDKYAPKRRDWRGRELDLPVVSCARRAATKLRIGGIVALLLLLTAQSYVLVGQNLLSAAPKFPDDYVETIALNNKQMLSTDDTRAGGDMNTNSAGGVLTQLNDLEKKMAHIQDIEEQRQRIGGMLKVWSNPSWFLVQLVTLKWSAFAPDSQKKLEYNSDYERTIMVSAQVIYVMQQIFLPIVYGLLGAMAYVLRRIARESAERTYREDNKTGYSLRILLGVVAGLAIGWFLRADQVGAGTTSVSPFALAFVSGYSVDLLFAAMDRLVLAFSGTPAGSASAAMAQPGMSGTKK